MKVDLLNDELSVARNRVSSLERALIGAREAIRVLRSGGNSNDSIQVSIPSNSNQNDSTSSQLYKRNNPMQNMLPLKNSGQENILRNQTPVTLPPTRAFDSVQAIPSGDSTLNLKVEVQFLNNRNRPAGFTEFFLCKVP